MSEKEQCDKHDAMPVTTAVNLLLSRAPHTVFATEKQEVVEMVRKLESSSRSSTAPKVDAPCCECGVSMHAANKSCKYPGNHPQSAVSAIVALPWSPEETAKRFHDAYELFAPAFGWATQEVSRKPWADLPQSIRDLMIAVVRNVLIEQARATSDGSDHT